MATPPNTEETTQAEIDSYTESSIVLEKYVETIYDGEHPGLKKIVEYLRNKVVLCEGHLTYLRRLKKGAEPVAPPSPGKNDCSAVPSQE